MEFLESWSMPAQLAFIAVLFGGGSVLGLYIVRRLVSVRSLQANHEVAGITFGILGAFYGLVLGFVIVAAWERFDQADANAHDEATALENLYKLGAGMAEPMRSQLDAAVLEYTRRVVDEEWPQMANVTYHAGKEGAHKLWSMVISYNPENGHEQMLLDKAVDQLSAISQARSQRLHFYEGNLPSMVWFIIYLGCLITIGFSFFFGAQGFGTQGIMCAFFSIWLGLTILAILELAHPYRGLMTIPDEHYRYAIARMEEAGKYRMSAALAPTAPYSSGQQTQSR